MDFTFHESEIRTAARLLGRVIAHRGDQSARKKRLLTGLAEIVRADAWAWTLHLQRPGRTPKLLNFMAAGIHGERLASYQNLAASHAPARTAEADEAPDWLTGLGIALGPALFAGISCPHQGNSLVGMFRKPNAREFSDREAAIYYLITDEIPWLHGTLRPSQSVSSAQGLTRRLETVLELLLKGFSRKQIAGDLGIRLNTVHGYVRAIYTHFQVNSHSTLLQACLYGDPTPQAHERTGRIVG